MELSHLFTHVFKPCLQSLICHTFAMAPRSLHGLLAPGQIEESATFDTPQTEPRPHKPWEATHTTPHILTKHCTRAQSSSLYLRWQYSSFVEEVVLWRSQHLRETRVQVQLLCQRSCSLLHLLAAGYVSCLVTDDRVPKEREIYE